MDQKISRLYKEIFSNPLERKAKRFESEVRVDVHNICLLNVISGDFYSKSERTRCARALATIPSTVRSEKSTAKE